MFGGALAIVTTTLQYWVLGLGGRWSPGLGTRHFAGGGLSYIDIQISELLKVFRFPASCQRLGRVYMASGGACKITDRNSLESDLLKWLSEQGVSVEGAAQAVHLLDANTLLAQPRPSRWNRRGNFGVQERCRYLWYRHAARILGWCERKRFPDFVTAILRGHVFPTHAVRYEAPGEDEEGRLSAGARAASRSIDADRHDAGQYSHIPTHLAIHLVFKGECGFRDH